MTYRVSVLIEDGSHRLDLAIPGDGLVQNLNHADVAEFIVIVNKLSEELQEFDTAIVLVVIVEARCSSVLLSYTKSERISSSTLAKKLL